VVFTYLSIYTDQSNLVYILTRTARILVWAIARINAKVGVGPCNYQTGVFVLRGVSPRHQHPKLALRLVGLYRIVQVLTDFNFNLQHLVSGEKCEVLESSILSYRNSDYDLTKEVIEHLEYQNG
jgi:hypothetical protein